MGAGFPQPPRTLCKSFVPLSPELGRVGPTCKTILSTMGSQGPPRGPAGRPNSESPGKDSKTSLNHTRTREPPLRRPGALGAKREGLPPREGNQHEI